VESAYFVRCCCCIKYMATRSLTYKHICINAEDEYHKQGETTTSGLLANAHSEATYQGIKVISLMMRILTTVTHQARSKQRMRCSALSHYKSYVVSNTFIVDKLFNWKLLKLW
jgi:hypothetical protein